MRESRREKIYLLTISLVSLLGLVFSLELVRVHHQVYAGKIPICSISPKVDCASVSRSPQSSFLGVPVAVWASLYYITIFWVTLSGYKKRIWSGIPYGILFLISVLGFFYSAYLFYIMVFNIKSLCIFCSFLDLFNLILIIVPLVAKGKLLFISLKEEIKTTFLSFFKIVWITLGYLLIVILLVIFYPNPSMLPKLKDKDNIKEGDQFSLPKGIDKSSLVSPYDYIIGDEKAPIEVIIFSDYQCPICREAYKELKVIIQQYKSQVKFVIKHFPLDKECNKDMEEQLHPGACISAIAAICAKKFGRFEEIENLLYRLNPPVTEEKIVSLSGSLGIPQDKFESCLKAKETVEVLKSNLEVAKKIGLSGTPSFIINREVLIPGWISGDIFRAIIEELLNATNSSR